MDNASPQEFAQVVLYTDFLYPGMQLKGDLITENGECINKAQMPIDLNLINTLKSRQIKKVFYHKPVMLDKEIGRKGVMALEVMEKAFSVSAEIADSIVKKKALPQKEIENTVEQFMEKISTAEIGTILNLMELKDYDIYTYTHSINVAMLSILFARQLKWTEEQIKTVGIGSMLHDMGKILMPPEVINKTGRLSPEEFEIVKKHTLFGYEIVRGQTSYNENIQKIPLLHHECYNGQGYPFGLNGEKITDMATIVSLVDYYDALTTQRSYKEALSPATAFIMIQKNSGTKFHPRYSTDFINKMPQRLLGQPLFETGTYVRLNTGELGEIVGLPSVETLKPRIRIYINQGKAMRKPVDVSLEIDQSRSIDQIVSNPAHIEILNKLRNSF